MAVSVLACAMHIAASTPVQAAGVDGLDLKPKLAEILRTPDVRAIRVAQASSNNPLAAFFSLFAKKKPRRTPVIQVPRTPAPRGGILEGRRIFNPYIVGGPRSNGEPQQSNTRNTGRRTMCVRLCDGYYWPMKRGGTNSSLMTDRQKCESQCTSKSRLFVLRSSTDNIASMRDLGGRRYSKLKNAFAYRKSYNPSCGCRAKPWSERARLRHKRYGAVGRERRVLAIRSIRMDLRSSLKPVALNVAVLSAADAPRRSRDPVLPARNPFRASPSLVRPEVRIMSFRDLPPGHMGSRPATGIQSKMAIEPVVRSSTEANLLNLRNRLN